MKIFLRFLIQKHSLKCRIAVAAAAAADDDSADYDYDTC